MKQHHKHLVITSKLSLCFVIIFLFIFFFTYFPYFNDGPRGIHQWAQADRVAISLRYAEGKALLDPATYSMKTPDGNTGVEFSGFQYVIAQFARISFLQKHLYFLLRLSTFLTFFSALFALVFTILRNEHLLARSFLMLTLISSPVLLFYGYNFLPDILALSLVLCCYTLLEINFEKHVITILLLSGLAMLIKTSSGIYFIAFMSLYVLKHIKQASVKLGFYLGIFATIAGVIVYYDYYYVHQRSVEVWSTVFLTQFVPVSSWSQFIDILDTASRYRFEYFTKLQWWLIISLGIMAIWHKRRPILASQNWRMAALLMAGLLCLTLLFGVQFMNHDYYVIATFMPAILYFTVKSAAYFAPYIHPRTLIIITLLLAVVSFSQGNSKYFGRMSQVVHIDGYPEPYERDWILGAAEIVNQYVPKENLIFSIYNMEPNWSLIYAGRKGAVFNEEEMKREQSPFLYYLPLIKPSHILCRTKFCQDFAKDQTVVYAKCNVVYTDANITLYSYGY